MQEGFHDTIEIGHIGAVHLGRDPERNARAQRESDRDIRTLLRRHAPEESQVRLGRTLAEPVLPQRHAVAHRREPAGIRQRLALILRNRHQSKAGPSFIHGWQILDVEATMQGGHGPVGERLEHRKVQQVEMEVQQIELRSSALDLMQHAQVCGEIGFPCRRVESYRLIPNRNQPGSGARIRGGEQSHVVPQGDEGIAKMRDHPFGAAIELGRYRLIERSNLSNLHGAHDLFEAVFINGASLLRFELPAISPASAA